MLGEIEYLHLIVTLPFKCSGFRPLFFVHTIRNGSFQQCSVTGVCTWQVVEFIQLVDSHQVHNQFERNGFFPVFRVPDISGLYKVEQTFHAYSSLRSGRTFAPDTTNSKFKRIGLGRSTELCPGGSSVFIDSTYFK